MAVRSSEVKNSKSKFIDFRKRVWVFWCLMCNGWDLRQDVLSDEKTLDRYLFSGDQSSRFTEDRNACMASFDNSYDNFGGRRQPGPTKAFSWATAEEKRRFHSWAIPYWCSRLRFDVPLYDNQYLPDRVKLPFWLDCMPGDVEGKQKIESSIKSVWSENKKIDKYIPMLGEDSDKEIFHFWAKTQSKLKADNCYILAGQYNPGFDTPVGEEDCWFSSVLLYDLLESSFEVKKDIIQGISRQWKNNNRSKKQKNLGLSSGAHSKLAEMAALKGLGEGELVEFLIWQEAQKLSLD